MVTKVDESMNLGEKDTTSHRKSLIKSTIHNLREELDILGFKIFKSKKRLIKKRIRIDKRIIDEDDDLDHSDIEHINSDLNLRERHLLKESIHYDHDKGIGDLRYLFDEDEDDDYFERKFINSVLQNNYSQYQATSDRKNMLPPSEYFEMIEPSLIKLINKHKNDNCKNQLTMKIIFTPIENVNDKRALYVKIMLK